MDLTTIIAFILSVVAIIYAQYKFSTKTNPFQSSDKDLKTINELTKELGSKSERIKILEEQLLEQKNNSSEKENL